MPNLTNFKGTGHAGIADIQTLLSAGINPTTGLPTRVSDSPILSKVKGLFAIIDEQDAVNRFVWENQQVNMPSRELERLVYLKYSLVFFYYAGAFFLLPYALDGGLDWYGRYRKVHPIPLAFGTDGEKEDDVDEELQKLLSTIKLRVVYDLNEYNDIDDKNVEATEDHAGIGVILRDYTNGISWEAIPRWQLNDCLLQLEAECVAYMNLNLLMGCGVSGVRVPDADSSNSVLEGSKGVKQYALQGNPWVPIIGTIEFQDLTDGKLAPVNEYTMALQSIDNLRLSTYGLDNTGLFEKKQHILESENELNNQKQSLVMDDGLKCREDFCKLVNVIFKDKLKDGDIHVRINKEYQDNVINKDITERVDETKKEIE